MLSRLAAWTTGFHFVIINIRAFQSYLVVGEDNNRLMSYFHESTHSVQIPIRNKVMVDSL